MPGKILIYLAFFSAIVSTILYIISIKKQGNLIKIARISFYVMFVSILGAAIYLLANILAHNFQITYVWEYSSRELNDLLLISSFYAGQQGSFMLWAIFMSIIGFLLLPYARKHDYENQVMLLFSLLMTFLALLLVVKSPFEYIWESFPNEGITSSFLPPNGKGMNPILQNYWMAIHPPILFIGYSLMSVQFVFALAGFFKKDFTGWIHLALPWTLFTAAVLGFGIMLGGFWAYETLGWGGFWGWDPVENSSLLPWLVAVALIHTMPVQKRTGGLIKTNYLLAALSFILVLYATFLTRSGVLDNASVHSFVNPGQFTYLLLLIFLLAFTLLSVIVLFTRLKSLPKFKSETKVLSREFALSIGSVVILAIMVIVFLGTSWPIITSMLNLQKSTVQTSFYDTWNLPLMIIVLLLNALSLYLTWKNTVLDNFIKKISVSLVLSLIITIALFFVGVNRPGLMILAFSSFFALLINAAQFFKTIRKSPRMTGALVSHAGVAVLMIGVLASGPFTQIKHISLKKGETKEALGYNITWTGKNQIEKHKLDREKYQYHIKVNKGGSQAVISPVVYWSSFNSWQSPYMEPGIRTFFSGDLYISPQNVESKLDLPYLLMAKGDKDKIPFDSTFELEFVKFDMSKAMEMQEDGKVVLGSVVNIHNGSQTTTDTLYADLTMETEHTSPVWKAFGNTGYEIGFMELVKNAESIALSKAVFAFKKAGEPLPEPTEVINLEISLKPFIVLVWIGVILTVIGFFISIYMHTKAQKKLITNIAE